MRVQVLGLGVLLACGQGVPAASSPDRATPKAEAVAAAAGVEQTTRWLADPLAPVVPPEEPVSPTADQLALIARRPYSTFVPSGYDEHTPVPLVLGLHGYSSTGAELDAWYALSGLAEARTFIVATPDGSKDLGQQRFWNATDACCNLYGAQVDDVGYLSAVIAELKFKYRIDAKRVFIVGHSNGSFMTHRMACDRADQVAAVAAFAGDVWKDAAKCQPSRPVSVLQIHGTSDPVINFAGVGLFPSADQSVATWAAKNGCDATRVSSGADLDLDTATAGVETTREKHDHCVAEGAAELWKIQGGVHHPDFTPEWAPQLYDWLMAHAR